MLSRFNGLIWLVITLLALLLVYVTGFSNVPVFDDGLLVDGTLFAEHGHLQQLRPRMLSYGSFVWVHDLFGAGWWKQRVFNLLLHIAVVLSLWGFYRELLRYIEPPHDQAGLPQALAVPYRDSPALGLAIAFFALNPMTVYAVGYLIQRSILMATLFVVLALWCFMRAVSVGRWGLYLLSGICYVLAVMSKEHAVLAPLAAVPLYIIAARPSAKKLLLLAVAGGLSVVLMAAVLWLYYGEIIGKPFDEYSHIYLSQLAQLGPDVEQLAYPLSILNQAYFFFKYGFYWLVPYTGWMSIDLRPPFPITMTSMPHLLGAIGFMGVLAGSVILVIRYRDWRALIGVSLLMPAVLFFTEFATVWVQDPFVLYRSYLWAIGLPGLVFFLFHGPAPKTLLGIGVILGGLFVWGGLERIHSLSTPERVWTDAIAKLPEDPRSVGRWFPYLNRGNVYLDSDRLNAAVSDFVNSTKLGDGGMGIYNIGALLYGEGKYAKSLEVLEQAHKQGYDLPSLYYQKGIAYMALAKPDDAMRELTQALEKNPGSPEREEILATRGNAYLQSGQHDAAIKDLLAVLKVAPKHKKARLSLGMAFNMKKDFARAHGLFTELLAEDQYGPIYYGRALANHGLRRKQEALADIRKAIESSPDNPNYQVWQSQIQAMP